MKKKKRKEHLRDRRYCCARRPLPRPRPPLDGIGLVPRGQHSRAVLLLREFLLQREGGAPGEHRGNCDARCPAAADARAPEQEPDSSGEDREPSYDAADDRRGLLRGRVRVRGGQLRRGQPRHGRLRRGRRRGRGEGPRLAAADFDSIAYLIRKDWIPCSFFGHVNECPLLHARPRGNEVGERCGRVGCGAISRPRIPREPLGTLARIAGAHERVDDGVALAQVVRIAGACRSRVRISRSQGRDREHFVVADALQVRGDETGALAERVERPGPRCGTRRVHELLSVGIHHSRGEQKNGCEKGGDRRHCAKGGEGREEGPAREETALYLVGL